MISQNMEKAFNAQVNEELYSSYLYLSMSAWYQGMNLSGFANWMRVQAQEELAHAMKIYDYVLERGGKVSLGQVKAPQGKWKNPSEPFAAAMKHEQHITGCINNLVNQAIEERDHAANIFLQWFVTEQVEEEANATDIVERLKLIGSAPGGLYMIDRELSSRQFVAPAAE